MKVVHITYSDSGGAGIAVVRIHKALLEQGIESRVLVAEKRSQEETIVLANESPDLVYTPPRNRVLRKLMKLMRNRGFLLSLREKYERKLNRIPFSQRTFFTSPLSRFDLARHPLVKDADIVHLHWVANYIDFPSFFPSIDKPIVWTLHDENMAYGGFHYGKEKERCYTNYASIEDAYCKIKQSSLSHCKSIHVVALSKMMKDFYATRSFLSDRCISIIHNGIDTSIFRVIDKSIGRQVYRIPKNNLVIVFCSVSLNDKRKGLADLLEAVARLDREDVTVLCIGNGHYEGDTSLDVRYTGPITNSDLLAMSYSCGDVFAFPSYQEAFAQTPLEAISCGLPIVAYPCSGMEELINEHNGIMCDDFKTDSFYQGLERVLGSTYDCLSLHEDIARRFSIERIASEYHKLYDSILQSNPKS